MRRAAQSSPYAGLGHPEGLGAAQSAVTQVPAASPHSTGQGPEAQGRPLPTSGPTFPLTHPEDPVLPESGAVWPGIWGSLPLLAPSLHLGGGVEVGGALEPPGP